MRVLYIIAKGSIDELLWILLQKKFLALGEFVEGEEEQQMVVHTTYKNVNDAVDRISGASNEIDADIDNAETESNLDVNVLANESSIVHDLEELAEEDTKIFVIDDDGEDEEDEVILSNESESMVDTKLSADQGVDTIVLDSKVESANDNFQHALGTGDDPICILDDDENDEVCMIENETMDMKVVYESFVSSKTIIPKIDSNVQMPSVRFYYIDFMGPSYHLVFRMICGRSIIIKLLPNTPKDVRLGDIIVRCNSIVFTHGMTTQKVKDCMSDEMKRRRPVRIYFAQDIHFKRTLNVSIERFKKSSEQSEQPSEEQTSNAANKNIEVIELD